jgi:hypothetical protein
MSLQEINELFDEYIIKGMENLRVFRIWLLEELEAGNELEVVIRGFASPLTYTDYNVNLTMRRIQSLVNHLERFDNGVLLPYIQGIATNGGRLTFVRLPFGEYAADQSISDDRLNTKQSVYSPPAALERRVEVEAVRVLNQNDNDAAVIPSQPSIDLGTINEDEIRTFEFYLESRSSEFIQVTDIKSPCGCTSVDMKNMNIESGEKSLVKVEFVAKGKSGHIVLPIEFTLSNGSKVLVYANVEVKK